MGGLMEHWQGPEGIVTTFTILTAEANPFMRFIHDRMPVIIQPDAYDRWLNSALTDPTEIRQFCNPYPEGFLEAWAVSKLINSPANDGPELLNKI
jgi:putative SOS response-associated peptidase YedK